MPLDQTTIITDPEERKAYEAIKKNLLLYQGINPKMRPKIPKLKTTKETKHLLNNVSNALDQLLHMCKDITSLHDHIYVTSISMIELHNQQVPKPRSAIRNKTTPAWETRLNRKINGLRKEIGILTQYHTNKGCSSQLITKALAILQKHIKDNNNDIGKVQDLCKQHLKVYANRMRRYSLTKEEWTATSFKTTKDSSTEILRNHKMKW